MTKQGAGRPKRRRAETRKGPAEGDPTPDALPEETAPAAGLSVEHCLDAMAGLIRTQGNFPIETPEASLADVQTECEAWARHLLLSTAAPGSDQPPAPSVRDWNGIERWFRELRQREHAHVITSMADLRQVIWLFVQVLGSATEDDASSDARTVDQLAKLRQAVQGSDLEALRKEASRSVNLIESQIEVRRARQQSQVADLSSQLDSITTALMIEKKRGEMDALTRVYGRAALDDQLADLCKMGAVIRPSAVLFLIDVDHFKWVNDKFGHGVGDDALRHVAARLRREFRRRGDFLARYGGDEFAAIVEGDGLKEATMIGERALYAVREAEVADEGEPVRVSISMGIAALRQGEKPAEWVKRADDALYRSKGDGRDRLAVAEEAE